MRLLKRNLRKITVQLKVGDKRPILDDEGFETGEFTFELAEPYPLWVSISSSKGEIGRRLFGNEDDYSFVVLAEEAIPAEAIIEFEGNLYNIKYDTYRTNPYGYGIASNDKS